MTFTFVLIGAFVALLLWGFLRRTYLTTSELQGNNASTFPKNSEVLPQKSLYERTSKKVFGSISSEEAVGLRRTVAFLYTLVVVISVPGIVLLDAYVPPTAPVLQSIFAGLGYIVLVFCAYLWFYFATVVYVESESQHTRECCPALHGLIGVARLELPRRCHRGDSHNITIEGIPDAKNPSNYLEIELQAAGMDVSGDEKQRQSLSSPKLYYRWNANFSKAGTHIVNVLLRELDATGQVIRYVEMKEYMIRVVTLYRQYGPSLIIAIATLVTLAYSMRGDLTTVLHSFGV